MKNQIFLLLSMLFIVNHITPAIPHKVVICGVCRDVAERIPYSMRIMENIGALFEDYRIIAYENNSNDETPQLLKKWQLKNSKVLALSEKITKSDLDKIIINRLENGDYYRPELISRARNIVLDKALSKEYQEFTYIIWMDMDFKLEPNYLGIEETFASPKEWDAVFAYGVDPYNKYWDWYAFRDADCPIGSELLGNDWWYLPKKLELDKNSEWYRVYSAFGGCGIYKKDSILGCRYSALATKDLALFSQNIIQNYQGSNIVIQKYLNDIKKIKKTIFISDISPKLENITDPLIGIKTHDFNSIIWKMSSFVYKYPSVCEHVPFHASMILNGHDKLFINPRLVFYYGDFIA